jgi:hypothetical protein
MVVIVIDSVVYALAYVVSNAPSFTIQEEDGDMVGEGYIQCGCWSVADDVGEYVIEFPTRDYIKLVDFKAPSGGTVLLSSVIGLYSSLF